ncbi:hypothetical protein Tsubulata_030552 [Turnera subulata]|uniref:Endonuclease V n=1 Tax=Turnera subulata TaxID=218843 RepID=A0A9Q0F8G5_9ROSI|nr:hypothetical protein Tsubulata_030552 [Turnera subulata]
MYGGEEEDTTSASTSTSDTTQDWITIQDSLKKRLITEDDFAWKLPQHGIKSSSSVTFAEQEEVLKYVGGVDVSYSKEEPSVAFAILVVLDVESLQVVYHDFSLVTPTVPYIPGFLAFREAPILLQLLEKMKDSSSSFYPQVSPLLVPLLGFGLACHLGVLADLPTIGIGKNLHHVDGLTHTGLRQLIESKENSGEDFVTLIGRSGFIWGAAMRSTEGSVKPIFISIGHRVSLGTAIKVVKLTCKYRVPEPIRQVRLLASEILKLNSIFNGLSR